MRGRDTLRDVVGKLSFSETFYFIVTGRLPSVAERDVFDACLVVLMDHGLTPTAMVARLVADSLPGQSQVAIAAGALMVGDRFVGSLAAIGSLLSEGVATGEDPKVWATKLVSRYRAEKQHMPGFGHPYYSPIDPRASRLLEVADNARISGPHIDRLHALAEELERSLGRQIVLNVTGVLGAILCEIQFPVSAMRGLVVVSRAAGLTAHVSEEQVDSIAPTLIDRAGEIPYEDPTDLKRKP